MSIFGTKKREWSVSRETLRNLLRENRISLERSLLWDKVYYGYSLVDWNKVFFEVLKNLPRYTRAKFDCDNFALLTAARTAEKYQVNGCGIAIGDSPWGYHAWNIFLARTYGSRWWCNRPELFYLEPQNGLIYEIDDAESGYRAHYVIWG